MKLSSRKNAYNGTHVKAIKTNYAGDTKQQSQRNVLIKNIAERTPSISSFLDLKQQIGDSLGHLRYETQNTK